MAASANAKSKGSAWLWQNLGAPTEQAGDRVPYEVLERSAPPEAPPNPTEPRVDALTGLNLAQTKANSDLSTALEATSKTTPVIPSRPEKGSGNESKGTPATPEAPLLPAVAAEQARQAVAKNAEVEELVTATASVVALSDPSAPENWDSILESWHQLLQQWAQDGSLAAAAQEAFNLDGPNAKPQSQGVLQSIVDQLAAGNFENLPEIVFLSGEDMRGAMGAYAISTGNIYLDADWAQNANSNAIHAVLTEEQGHHLDGMLNKIDIPGDEGEAFSKLLLGSEINQPKTSDLSNENDSISISIDGHLVQAEAATITAPTQGPGSDPIKYLGLESLSSGTFYNRYYIGPSFDINIIVLDPSGNVIDGALASQIFESDDFGVWYSDDSSLSGFWIQNPNYEARSDIFIDLGTEEGSGDNYFTITAQLQSNGWYDLISLNDGLSGRDQHLGYAIDTSLAYTDPNIDGDNDSDSGVFFIDLNSSSGSFFSSASGSISLSIPIFDSLLANGSAELGRMQVGTTKGFGVRFVSASDPVVQSFAVAAETDSLSISDLSDDPQLLRLAAGSAWAVASGQRVVGVHLYDNTYEDPTAIRLGVMILTEATGTYAEQLFRLNAAGQWIVAGALNSLGSSSIANDRLLEKENLYDQTFTNPFAIRANGTLDDTDSTGTLALVQRQNGDYVVVNRPGSSTPDEDDLPEEGIDARTLLLATGLRWVPTAGQRAIALHEYPDGKLGIITLDTAGLYREQLFSYNPSVRSGLGGFIVSGAAISLGSATQSLAVLLEKETIYGQNFDLKEAELGEYNVADSSASSFTWIYGDGGVSDSSVEFVSGNIALGQAGKVGTQPGLYALVDGRALLLKSATGTPLTLAGLPALNTYVASSAPIDGFKATVVLDDQPTPAFQLAVPTYISGLLSNIDVRTFDLISGRQLSQRTVLATNKAEVAWLESLHSADFDKSGGSPGEGDKTFSELGLLATSVKSELSDADLVIKASGGIVYTGNGDQLLRDGAGNPLLFSSLIPQFSNLVNLGRADEILSRFTPDRTIEIVVPNYQTTAPNSFLSLTVRQFAPATGRLIATQTVLASNLAEIAYLEDLYDTDWSNDGVTGEVAKNFAGSLFDPTVALNAIGLTAMTSGGIRYVPTDTEAPEILLRTSTGTPLLLSSLLPQLQALNLAGKLNFISSRETATGLLELILPVYTTTTATQVLSSLNVLTFDLLSGKQTSQRSVLASSKADLAYLEAVHGIDFDASGLTGDQVALVADALAHQGISLVQGRTGGWFVVPPQPPTDPAKGPQPYALAPGDDLDDAIAAELLRTATGGTWTVASGQRVVAVHLYDNTYEDPTAIRLGVMILTEATGTYAEQLFRLNAAGQWIVAGALNSLGTSSIANDRLLEKENSYGQFFTNPFAIRANGTLDDTDSTGTLALVQRQNGDYVVVNRGDTSTPDEDDLPEEGIDARTLLLATGLRWVPPAGQRAIALHEYPDGKLGIITLDTAGLYREQLFSYNPSVRSGLGGFIVSGAAISLGSATQSLAVLLEKETIYGQNFDLKEAELGEYNVADSSASSFTWIYGDGGVSDSSVEFVSGNIALGQAGKVGTQPGLYALVDGRALLLKSATGTPLTLAGLPALNTYVASSAPIDGFKATVVLDDQPTPAFQLAVPTYISGLLSNIDVRTFDLISGRQLSQRTVLATNKAEVAWLESLHSADFDKSGGSPGEGDKTFSELGLLATSVKSELSDADLVVKASGGIVYTGNGDQLLRDGAGNPLLFSSLIPQFSNLVNLGRADEILSRFTPDRTIEIVVPNYQTTAPNSFLSLTVRQFAPATGKLIATQTVLASNLAEIAYLEDLYDTDWSNDGVTGEVAKNFAGSLFDPTVALNAIGLTAMTSGGIRYVPTDTEAPEILLRTSTGTPLLLSSLLPQLQALNLAGKLNFISSRETATGLLELILPVYTTTTATKVLSSLNVLTFDLLSGKQTSQRSVLASSKADLAYLEAVHGIDFDASGLTGDQVALVADALAHQGISLVQGRTGGWFVVPPQPPTDPAEGPQPYALAPGDDLDDAIAAELLRTATGGTWTVASGQRVVAVHLYDNTYEDPTAIRLGVMILTEATGTYAEQLFRLNAAGQWIVAGALNSLGTSSIANDRLLEKENLYDQTFTNPFAIRANGTLDDTDSTGTLALVQRQNGDYVVVNRGDTSTPDEDDLPEEGIDARTLLLATGLRWVPPAGQRAIALHEYPDGKLGIITLDTAGLYREQLFSYNPSVRSGLGGFIVSGAAISLGSATQSLAVLLDREVHYMEDFNGDSTIGENIKSTLDSSDATDSLSLVQLTSGRIAVRNLIQQDVAAAQQFSSSPEQELEEGIDFTLLLTASASGWQPPTGQVAVAVHRYDDLSLGVITKDSLGIYREQKFQWNASARQDLGAWIVAGLLMSLGSALQKLPSLLEAQTDYGQDFTSLPANSQSFWRNLVLSDAFSTSLLSVDSPKALPLEQLGYIGADKTSVTSVSSTSASSGLFSISRSGISFDISSGSPPDFFGISNESSSISTTFLVSQSGPVRLQLTQVYEESGSYKYYSSGVLIDSGVDDSYTSKEVTLFAGSKVDLEAIEASISYATSSEIDYITGNPYLIPLYNGVEYDEIRLFMINESLLFDSAGLKEVSREAAELERDRVFITSKSFSPASSKEATVYYTTSSILKRSIKIAHSAALSQWTGDGFFLVDTVETATEQYLQPIYNSLYEAIGSTLYSYTFSYDLAIAFTLGGALLGFHEQDGAEYEGDTEALDTVEHEIYGYDKSGFSTTLKTLFPESWAAFEKAANNAPIFVGFDGTSLGFDVVTGLPDLLFGETPEQDAINFLGAQSSLIGDNQVFVALGACDIVTGAGLDLVILADDTDNVDINSIPSILDFSSSNDKVLLPIDTFLGLAGNNAGAISPNLLAFGEGATNSTERIIYDATSGNLYYDADGSGITSKELIAYFLGNPVLTATNFLIG